MTLAAMDTAAILPHLNAGLNSITIVLLLIGFGLIRTGRRTAHRAVMLAAVGVSAAFLVSYLIYHFTAPVFIFPGTGWERPVYFTLLGSHVILATLAAPLIVLTVWRALRGQIVRHRALARWVWPLWLYVAVTGVVIYALLYHVYTPA